jgi:hypothetical protein
MSADRDFIKLELELRRLLDKEVRDTSVDFLYF